MKYVSKRFSGTIFLLLCIFLGQVSMSRPAYADVTLKDVQTVIRTIGFLENRESNQQAIAIIYNPDHSGSQREARQVQELFASSKSNLLPRMVPVSALGEIQNVQYAFVTEGLQQYYKQLDIAFRQHKVLSFTLERSCIDNDCCAVYINAKNRVEIVINKKVSDAAQARFKPLFLMMVTVI